MIIPSHIVAQAEASGLVLCSVRPTRVREGDALVIDGRCLRVHQVEIGVWENEAVTNLLVHADDEPCVSTHYSTLALCRARDDERLTIWRARE